MGSTDRNKRRWGSSSASSPPPNAFAGSWCDLPDVLLLAVLDRLSSLRDIFAVCAVCRSWRAVFRPFLSSAAGLVPPLLLRPIVNHRKRIRAYNRRCMTVPTRCDLICLGNPSANLRSMISSSTLGLRLIGSSYGQLIFSNGRRVVIADAFTEDELHAPCVAYDSQGLYYAALTSPLSSPDSYLLLCYDQKLLWWRAGDLDYGLHWFQPHSFHIVQVVACKEKFFALGSDERLHLIEFSPFSMQQLAVRWNDDNIWTRSFGFRSHLVECGGELLLVRIVQASERCETYFKFTVHRLDLSLQPRWVKVDNLGHWALFIHEAANGSMSCAYADRWGGKNNCIYYVGRGSRNWFEFPLDDTTIDSTEPESPLYFRNQMLSKWPSPAWIYPSMLY